MLTRSEWRRTNPLENSGAHRAVNPDLQRWASSRIGARVPRVVSSHVPRLSGEIGLLTGAPRVGTATALTDARLSVIDKSALEASVKRSRNLYTRNEAALRSEEVGRPEDLLGRILHVFSRA